MWENTDQKNLENGRFSRSEVENNKTSGNKEQFTVNI